jgi:PST family polysaccharide transporter
VCAPWLAAFYQQPILIPITRALAPTFFLNGLGSQIRAQLTRDFRMTSLSVAALAAQSAGLAAGLGGALLGFGTWALVAQQLTFNSVHLLLIANAARFWPGLPQRNADIRGFLRFGGNLLANSLINQLSRSLNPVLIGNRFGAEIAGLYDRAFMLLMLPLNQINVPASTVALPTLSKLQDDPTRFARFLLHAQTVLLHLLSFIFAYAAAVGDVLIEIVMGEQWRPAAPLFRIFCIAGAFQATGYTINWAFIAKGLTHQIFRYTLVTRLGFVALMLAALHWGVQAVTIAYAVGMAVMWPLGLIWLSRTSDAPALDMAKSGLRCLVAYGVCGAAALGGAGMAASASAYIQIAASISGMAGCMLLLYLTWPAYRRDLLAIIHTRSLLRAAKTPHTVPTGAHKT